MLRTLVSSSITHRCVVFVFHLSSLNLYLLITTVVVINYGLECFIDSVLAYFHILHIHCLIISLNC